MKNQEKSVGQVVWEEKGGTKIKHLHLTYEYSNRRLCDNNRITQDSQH